MTRSRYLAGILASGHSTFRNFGFWSQHFPPFFCDRSQSRPSEPGTIRNLEPASGHSQSGASDLEPEARLCSISSTRSGCFAVGFWRHEPSGTQARNTSNQKRLLCGRLLAPKNDSASASRSRSASHSQARSRAQRRASWTRAAFLSCRAPEAVCPDIASARSRLSGHCERRAPHVEGATKRGVFYSQLHPISPRGGFFIPLHCGVYPVADEDLVLVATVAKPAARKLPRDEIDSAVREPVSHLAI